MKKVVSLLLVAGLMLGAFSFSASRCELPDQSGRPVLPPNFQGVVVRVRAEPNIYWTGTAGEVIDGTMDILRWAFLAQGFTETIIQRDGTTNYFWAAVSRMSDNTLEVSEVIRILNSPFQIEFRFRGVPIINGHDIVSAFALIQPPNDHVVFMTFNSHGTDSLRHVTQNIGESVEIWTVIGEGGNRVETLIFDYTIQEHITTGQLTMYGFDSANRANELAGMINAGRLPMELYVVDYTVNN